MGRFDEGGSRDNFGSQEKHKTKCSKCGKDCEVPFKPKEGRPVFCGDCYRSQNKSRSRY